jgi:hypothetical protein
MIQATPGSQVLFVVSGTIETGSASRRMVR